MRAPRPLNPGLYHSLTEAFGEVRLAREGEAAPEVDTIRPLLASRVRDASGRRRPRKPPGGEEYRVNCPFCDDTRFRLSINHRWGVLDERDGDRHWYLANCYNEDCLAEPLNLFRLKHRVFAFGPAKQRLGRLRPGRPPRPAGPVEPPGKILPLGALSPRHVARQYLLGRGLDPDYLEKMWQVGWCQQSRFRLAEKRIYIPVYRHGELVFWQARYPADHVNGRTFKEAGFPKYWSAPGGRKKDLAYNLARALRFKTVFVVEGPVDCWAAGLRSFGLMGKTMSLELLSRIAGILRRYGVPLKDMTFVVVLDPEQDERAKARGKPHHIETVCGSLRQLGPCRALPLYMAPGQDPGGCDPYWFRDWARATAWREHRVRLVFDRPLGV